MKRFSLCPKSQINHIRLRLPTRRLAYSFLNDLTYSHLFLSRKIDNRLFRLAASHNVVHVDLFLSNWSSKFLIWSAKQPWYINVYALITFIVIEIVRERRLLLVA